MVKKLILANLIAILLLAGCIEQLAETPKPSLLPTTTPSPEPAPTLIPAASPPALTPEPGPTPTPVSEPPAVGDWIINSQQTIKDKTITLSGNLIVNNGGSLKLEGVKLTVNSTHDGQYKISVEPGGSLYVYGTTITSANPEHRFAFIAAGSAFEMKNSELHGAGWGRKGEEWDEKAVYSGRLGLVVETDNALIESNMISANAIGIVLVGFSASIAKNTIDSNDAHGVYVYGGSDSRITENYIRYAAGSPLMMVRTHGNHITKNTIVSSTNNGGIEAFTSHGNVFENNQISGKGAGIAAFFVSNKNVIKGNTISMDELGIWLWGWNNRIEDNTISGDVGRAVTGIYMVYAYNTTIAGNTIKLDKDLNGIMVRHSSNNVIFNNQVSTSAGGNRNSGILLFSSSKGNIIQGNILSQFPTGVSLFFSSDRNQLNGNQVSGNGTGSVFISDSSENVIYGNTFLGSGPSPYDDSNNQWDYQGTGNYWSSHKLTDSNSDGVGDTPYAISSTASDRFPAMKVLPVAISVIPRLEPLPMTNIPSVFNLTMNDNRVIENQTIYLGNIMVGPRGSLTLRNVTLITGGSEESSSLAARGGSLYIYDSKIVQMEYGTGAQIRADEGATFVMKNTEVRDVGHEWWYGGIQMYTDNVVFENNVFSDTILWFENSSSGARVVGNTILSSLSAIVLDYPGSKNFIISNNKIQRTIWDALNINGENNQITGNTISDVALGNAASYHGNSSTISDNRISKVHFAAVSIVGDGGIAKGNVITNSNGGIMVNGSGNQVLSNAVSDCVIGIGLSGQDNTAYHNNLVNNENQARDSGKNNHWDYNGQGNYWSDYKGRDANGDGIGDTPYPVPSNGIDNFPLMKPYS